MTATPSPSLASPAQIGRPARRRTGWASGAALLWGVVFFAAAQVFLAVRMDTAQPELRDPEFGLKLARLRALLRAHPGRPLVLVLGSSRPDLAFRPEVLMGDGPEASRPLLFNFGLTGFGPIPQYLCLRRLLAEGIRPQWVIAEVLAPVLHQEPGPGNETWLSASRLGWGDLAVLRPYCRKPVLLYRDWLAAHLVPAFTQRFGVLARYARRWLPPQALEESWPTMTSLGWVRGPEGVDAATRRGATAHAHDQYVGHFQDFAITPTPDRALRQLLAVCRQEGIRPVLVLMPEGSAFRGWYPPTARAQIDGYLGRLSRDTGVPVIDTRTWMADEDFFDSHHLLVGGATKFTRRFQDEVLRPLLHGKPCGSCLVW